MAYVTHERKNLICDLCDDLTPHIRDYINNQDYCCRCQPYTWCTECEDYTAHERGDSSRGESSVLTCGNCGITDTNCGRMPA